MLFGFEDGQRLLNGAMNCPSCLILTRLDRLHMEQLLFVGSI